MNTRQWEMIRTFNLLLRKPPITFDELGERARFWAVELTSEVHEWLRAHRWKQHRNVTQLDNRPKRLEELADIAIDFFSAVQDNGFSLQELTDAVDSKHTVVRFRHLTEWQDRITRPCVVLDLDNVLCDYIRGLCEWLDHSAAGHLVPRGDLDLLRIQEIARNRTWCNARSLGITEQLWQEMKHALRTSGLKRNFPLMPGAREFLEWCKTTMGWQIIVLTSRPFAEYPNLFTDTMMWFDQNNLPLDALWCSRDKGELVLTERVQDLVQFVVDDEQRYVEQFVKTGIPVYWYNRRSTLVAVSDRPAAGQMQEISGLGQICNLYTRKMEQEQP